MQLLSSRAQGPCHAAVQPCVDGWVLGCCRRHQRSEVVGSARAADIAIMSVFVRMGAVGTVHPHAERRWPGGKQGSSVRVGRTREGRPRR